MPLAADPPRLIRACAGLVLRMQATPGREAA